MPDRWAVATGNWSSTATWNGGTLPGSGDDVFADGRTVTIDQDITVLSIRTTQRSGGTAGGGFTASGTRVINANITAGTTDCLSISAASANITVNGNVTGGTASGADGILCTANNTTTLIVSGNVTGGSAANATGINNTSSAIVTVTGTCTGGSNATAHGLALIGGTVTLNGNCTSATGFGVNVGGTSTSYTQNGNPTNDSALAITSATSTVNLSSSITGTGANGNVRITGGSCDISGGSLNGGASASQIALSISAGGCRLTGNVNASANSSCIAVTGGALSVIGNVLANGASNAIDLASAGNLFVVGNVTGGTTGDGINSSGTIRGCIISVQGTVTGGSSSGGYGIRHNGRADIRIYGSEASGSGDVAVSNVGTGTKTTTAVGGGGSSGGYFRSQFGGGFGQ